MTERQKKQELIKKLEKLVPGGNRVYYAHFIAGKGTLTVAVSRHSELVDFIQYGYSLCAPEDQFSRSEGRLRAVRRLVSNEHRLEYEVAGNIGSINPYTLCQIAANDLLRFLESAYSRPSWSKEDPEEDDDFVGVN